MLGTVWMGCWGQCGLDVHWKEDPLRMLQQVSMDPTNVPMSPCAHAPMHPCMQGRETAQSFS